MPSRALVPELPSFFQSFESSVPVFVDGHRIVYRYSNLARVNLFRRLLPRYRVLNEGQAGLNVIHTRGLNLKR